MLVVHFRPFVFGHKFGEQWVAAVGPCAVLPLLVYRIVPCFKPREVSFFHFGKSLPPSTVKSQHDFSRGLCPGTLGRHMWSHPEASFEHDTFAKPWEILVAIFLAVNVHSLRQITPKIWSEHWWNQKLFFTLSVGFFLSVCSLIWARSYPIFTSTTSDLSPNPEYPI